MFCRKCGMANPASGQFCSKCGAKLNNAASAPPAPPSASIPQMATGQPTRAEPPTATSGKAIGSLISGIFSIFFPAAIAAVILGHLSLSDIKKSAGGLTGRGMAIAGLVLGYLGVVMIPFILIIAAIAIPNLLRARMAANEASAVGSLRALNTAAVQYAASYQNGYPSSLQVLGYDDSTIGNCNHAGIIDRTLASGQKNGYELVYTAAFPDQATKPAISPKAAAAGCTAGGASGYAITADPIEPNKSGRRHFYTDQTGVIRASSGDEQATVDSEPLD